MSNPFSEIADQFDALAAASVAPPIVPQSALLVDYEQIEDLASGIVMQENRWTAWGPSQQFEVVGSSPLILCHLNCAQSGQSSCGETRHSEGAFRFNIDNGNKAFQFSGWVWGLRGTQLANNYAQFNGGEAYTLLSSGHHTVVVEYMSYYLDTLAFLRPLSMRGFEFFRLQVVQLGS